MILNRYGSISLDRHHYSKNYIVAYFQNKKYLIPGLVDDVVLEIFPHFIAVDLNGPFSLMLVCSAWRDRVLSNGECGPGSWLMILSQTGVRKRTSQ
jgi:hypothetical protein